MGIAGRLAEGVVYGAMPRDDSIAGKTPKQIAERRIRQAVESGARELDLSRLALREPPSSIRQLTDLRKLYLGGNNLTTLPDWIGQLTRLEGLFLDDNNLTTLPDSIGQLTDLLFLNLDDNRFVNLPDCIGSLPLKGLFLDRNRLVAFPDYIGDLATLETLDAPYNELTSLPQSINRLRKLAKLSLHENPGLGIPPEVLGPTWQDVDAGAAPAAPTAILDYYFRTRKEAGRPLNEAKLILVGRGAAGKTSLVNRLIEDKFNRRQRKTDGIKITDWPRTLPNGDNIHLNVWDFGGQEIMHATHQFFLTQRSLYLLVITGREGTEDEDAEYWLRIIESFGGDSPVIVVLNKINEHAFNVNRRALQAKYPGIREFIETDCEDRTGIDDLHAAILRETDQLEGLRDVFPASWFDIKQKLGRTKKNYLTFEEYRSFCRDNGEDDDEAQERLAGYLHSLGIALNYRDDPRLRDHHVLNPHWVTGGIYKLLNAKKLADQQGVLSLDDVGDVLDKTYPKQMHPFLLDLMKKFELCFSYPGQEDRYLVPELLDKQEPEDAADFDPQECLNFQYHYPVLPEGLLPRFIVRTHVLSEEQPRWRTGVILSFDGNRALVKADAGDKRVYVSVTGPTEGRRRLLAVIRSDFEHIHRDISKLEPKEMVPVPGHPDTVIPFDVLRVFEANGEMSHKTVIDGTVAEVEVGELLNGVDVRSSRPRTTLQKGTDREGGGDQPLRLFYSYSHKDEHLRNEMETHLKLLERQGLIAPWNDRLIGAGEEGDNEISDNLERADIIVLLISADFMASDYCYGIEMQRAMERHEAHEARVIPVIVRDVNWHSAPFGKLQALPTDGKAVTTWSNKDTAWKDVSKGIEAAVNELS